MSRSPPATAEQQRAAEALAKLALDHRLHQNLLIWRQIQTLLTLQAGTLAAMYATRGSVVAYFAGAVGIGMTLVVLLYVERLSAERDLNMDFFLVLTRFFAAQLPAELLTAVDQTHQFGGRPAFDPHHPVRIYFPIPDNQAYMWTEVRMAAGTWPMLLVRPSQLLRLLILGLVAVDLVFMLALHRMA